MEFRKQYLTYAEYRVLGGNLAEMPFNLQEFKARQKINKLTMNRLVGLEEQNQQVKLCVNELINEYQRFNNLSNSGEKVNAISSEKVGDWSASYANITADQQITLSKQEEQNLDDIVKTYLTDCKLEDGTPYLYVGF